jgi:hypothetical protein
MILPEPENQFKCPLIPLISHGAWLLIKLLRINTLYTHPSIHFLFPFPPTFFSFLSSQVSVSSFLCFSFYILLLPSFHSVFLLSPIKGKSKVVPVL